MVAESYKTATILSDPVISDGKMYVKIRTKAGKEKIVRWYLSPDDSPESRYRIYGFRSPDTTIRFYSAANLNQSQKDFLMSDRKYVFAKACGGGWAAPIDDTADLPYQTMDFTKFAAEMDKVGDYDMDNMIEATGMY